MSTPQPDPVPQIGVWEGLSFVCELAMLAALAVGGWHLGGSTPSSAAAAVGLPAAAVLVWGLWLAPRAPRRLRGLPLLLAKGAVFVAAGVVLAAAGHPAWAAALLVISLTTVGVTYRQGTL